MNTAKPLKYWDSRATLASYNCTKRACDYASYSARQSVKITKSDAGFTEIQLSGSAYRNSRAIAPSLFLVLKPILPARYLKYSLQVCTKPSRGILVQWTEESRGFPDRLHAAQKEYVCRDAKH